MDRYRTKPKHAYEQQKQCMHARAMIIGVPNEVEKACQDNPVALERVAQLDVPMLMLSADFDWFFSRAMLSRSAQHCRKCTFVECDGHGHSIYFENPGLFHKAAVEWMRGAG